MGEKNYLKKIINISGEDYALSGNKDVFKNRTIEGFHHIEDYFFDKFLIEEPFYILIYYELLKIETHFRHLKEFLVQFDWIVIRKIVHDIHDLSISKIISNIDDYFVDRLMPIELLFCYQIIADYFKDVVFKENVERAYIEKAQLFTIELQTIFKREIIHFPVRVEFSADFITTPTNEPGANGKWWVYFKSENLSKLDIEKEIGNGKKIMVNCSPAQFATLFEILMDKDYLQKRTNAEGTAKVLLKIFEFKNNSPSIESLGKVLFKEDRKINADDYEGLNKIIHRKYLKGNKD